MYKEIKLVITDVDGVLTDGGITYDGNGNESKTFNVRDGAAVFYLRRAGIITAIISGRNCDAVFVRAEELKIEDVYLGHLDKRKPYEELKKKYHVTDDEIAYIGDDLTDIPILKQVGLPASVCDASKEVLEIAKFVSSRPGGRGAFRELAEAILKAQGKWAATLEKYQ